MDSLQDFFKEAKNRIVNPLFFSFAISWLLWNWKVSVGFLMYNQETLKNFGYLNYRQLIEQNASWEYYLWHPLCSALIYTIVFPPIRVLIIAFLSWMDRISTWSKKKILKNSTVPMARFIKETDRTDSLSKKLDELYSNEKGIKDENDNLKKELNEEQYKVRELQNGLIRNEEDLKTSQNKIAELLEVKKNNDDDIFYYSRMDDQTVINGGWRMQAVISSKQQSRINTPTFRNFNIIIEDEKIHMMVNNVAILWGEIIAFTYNYKAKCIFITMIIEANLRGETIPQKLYHQKLHIAGHVNNHVIKMSGKDSDGNNISYEYNE